MEYQKALPGKPEWLANLVFLDQKIFLRDVWPKISQFFTLQDGLYHHKRCDTEIARQQRLRQNVREAAQQSVRARWGEGTKIAPGYASKRSARLADARKLGTHTKEEWLALCDVFGNACVKCGRHASELIGNALCKDHVTPIFTGGSDAITNIQPMCKHCNSGKQADKSDYRAKIPDWHEQLKSRLRNAYETPTRTPTRMPPNAYTGQDSRGQDINITTTVPVPAREPTVDKSGEQVNKLNGGFSEHASRALVPTNGHHKNGKDDALKEKIKQQWIQNVTTYMRDHWPEQRTARAIREYLDETPFGIAEYEAADKEMRAIKSAARSRGASH